MSERIFLSPPHMSGLEIEFVRQAFESNYIAPLGPMVDAFEKEFSRYTGLPHAVALSSGTAAMHLALRNLGVGPGDEVIASTLTFIGSVTPIIFQGAVPVLIDSDRASWNMDPGLLEAELGRCAKRGRLPKAVIPTDLYGQCCDMDRILAICGGYDIPVVFDAAEALGATYGGRSAGTGGMGAVFSFNGNKIVTTSGGGMLASDDRDFIEHARFLSQQARDPAPHYEHSEIGYNYRMSNIVAAIGRGQLSVLEERVARKRAIFARYREGLGDLPGIEFMPEAPYGHATRWLTVILVSPEAFGCSREDIRLALEAENIESRPVWKPMHVQPVFEIVERRDIGYRISDIEKRRKEEAEIQSEKLKVKSEKDEGQGEVQSEKLKVQSAVNPKSKIQNPKSNTESRITKYAARVVGGAVSEDFFLRGLCLPSGTQMTDEDLDRIVRTIRKMQK